MQCSRCGTTSADLTPIDYCPLCMNLLLCEACHITHRREIAEDYEEGLL